MALFPTLSSISPPMGIQISVLKFPLVMNYRTRFGTTYAKLTMEYVRPNLPPTSLALEICPMQAGARLRNDPEANPKMTEKT